MGGKSENGRNSLCPCGSGKKVKHCCKGTPQPAISPFSFAMADMNLQRLIDQNRKQKFGEIRPLVHTEWQGSKIVAVGSKVFYGNWKTPIDFLFDFYIKRVLSKHWGKAELTKPLADRHLVMQWYDSLCRLQAQQAPGDNSVYGFKPNGAALSYLLFAFDLFAAQHHGVLKKDLLRRLRRKEHFQGARHELFAIATCIRAGCEIEFEDESDGSKRHVEFIAVHRRTGQRIAVEAKSRHRPGVLGFKGDRPPDDAVEVGIQGLVRDALGKPVSDPYVIFVDVNLPPDLEPVNTKWLDKVGGPILDEWRQDGAPDPWNMILFTSFPHHYGDDSASAPLGKAVGLLGKNPIIAETHPEVIREIYEAARKFGALPNRFEDLQ